MNSAAAAKQKLRAHFRHTRQSLSIAAQRGHEMALAQHAKEILDAQPGAHNIAIYLEFDGEIGTQNLIQLLRRRGKNVFTPIIANNEMTFAPLGLAGMQQDSPLNSQQLIPNRRRITPNQLDLVFMPLVAFDATGVRLGMGGGFYDRCFSFKRKAPARKPLLVGVAHQCQQAGVGVLPKEIWDLQLDWRITETGLRKCLHRSRQSGSNDE
ncbi:MAG: 5-formyltetrahydrofolate cyclo-ligase [Pseudomonadales bacterium]